MKAGSDLTSYNIRENVLKFGKQKKIGEIKPQ